MFSIYNVWNFNRGEQQCHGPIRGRTGSNKWPWMIKHSLRRTLADRLYTRFSTLPHQPLLSAKSLKCHFPLACPFYAFQSNTSSWITYQKIPTIPRFPCLFSLSKRLKTVRLVVQFLFDSFSLQHTPWNCLSVFQCGGLWGVVWRRPLGSCQLDLFFNLEGFSFRISLRRPNYSYLAALGSHFDKCCHLLRIYAAHRISVFQRPIRRGRSNASYWSFLPQSVFIDAFGLEELFVMVEAVEVSLERDVIP